MFEIFFWFMIGLVFYVYAGYPLVLYVLSLVMKQKIDKSPIEPAVSVLISAYNEEKVIERRIENLLSLDYPQEKLEILIGSDGSKDRTNEIVAGFAGQNVHLLSSAGNSGKPSVLNKLAKIAKGDILVLTDSRQEFDAGAIRALVRNFNDPAVGCVSGELHFKQENLQQVGKGMGAYWRYEKFLRKKEAEIGSMLGATCAIYAVRKELFPDTPADVLVDDMYIPLSIIKRGYRAVFESDACAYDVPSERSDQEFTRKVRTLIGNYQIYGYFKQLFVPFLSPIALQLISHKLLRLFVPFLLIGILALNVFLLEQRFYLVLFLAQVLFYGLAWFESMYEKSGLKVNEQGEKVPRKSVGYIPYIFCILNYSAFVAFFRYIRGKYHIVWEKAYK